jgi:4-alpha-glucanotransferase
MKLPVRTSSAQVRPPFTRSAGILLHVTSLPSRYGIGDLGPAAYRWVDQLARAKQSWWQVLPLGPPGAGNSPYQAFSAFAGNPALVSPERLMEEGLLNRADLAHATRDRFPAGRVDFPRAGTFRAGLITNAWQRFAGGTAGRRLRGAFEAFTSRHKAWLDDFTLFMALKEARAARSWTDWPKPLVLRDRAALADAKRDLAEAIGRHQFGQFLFFRQLEGLRQYARQKGVRLIGDLPIYVSPESSDVWARPHLFLLDRQRRPTAVAGVPPDLFSRTGQRWGNPLYDWPAMRRDGFAWWVDRMRATLAQVDVVRLDHFRGFAGYWKIPAHLPTAVRGRWVKGPGTELFDALRKGLGKLPLIAEDLGVITPDVERLRDEFGLPGMRVLQFAFGGDPDNLHLPHQHVRNVAAYTGTHDNETTAGWYAGLDRKHRDLVHRYAPDARTDPVWALIRLAWSSVAKLAIAPMQDVLRLGNEARMNTPGTALGNWGWRMAEGMLRNETLDRLGELTETYGRVVGSAPL